MVNARHASNLPRFTFRISFARQIPALGRSALASSAKLTGAKAGDVLYASRKKRLKPLSDVKFCCGKGLTMCTKAG